MTTLLPHDDSGEPIPALRLKTDGAHNIAVTASSARNSIAFADNTRVISIFATGPVHIKTGGATVEADSADHFFPANVYYDISLGDRRHGARHTHIAAIRADYGCTLYISEKE